MGSAIRPILNKVVVQVQKSDRATGGGIILAGSSKEALPVTAETTTPINPSAIIAYKR